MDKVRGLAYRSNLIFVSGPFSIGLAYRQGHLGHHVANMDMTY